MPRRSNLPPAVCPVQGGGYAEDCYCLSPSPALQIDPYCDGRETDARCCTIGSSARARREVIDECGQETAYALLSITDIAVLAVNGSRMSGKFVRDILVSIVAPYANSKTSRSLQYRDF